MWRRTHRGPGGESVSSDTTKSDVKVKTYPVSQTSQNTHFHKRLLMEPLFVTDDLDGNNATIFVDLTSDDLSKRTLTKYVNNLVPIGEVVAKHNIVITTLVVVAVVARLIFVTAQRRDRSNDLFRILCTGEVDSFLVVVHDLTTLEDVEGTVAIM